MERMGLLLERVKAGDHAAWTIFFKRENAKLLNYAKRMIANREDVEEIVQEAWLRGWEGRAQIEDLARFLQHEVRELAKSRRRKKSAVATESYPALVECEDGVFPGEAHEGLRAVEAVELPAEEEVDEEVYGDFPVKPVERFQEQMQRRVETFGEKALDRGELQIALGLWLEKRPRAVLAHELGMNTRQLERAIRVIMRKLEAAERAA